MKIINTIRPTQHQQYVLAVAASAATPQIAYSEIAGDTNTVAAMKMLGNLGCVEYTQSECQLTDAGRNVAIQDGIIDDAGELTQKGEGLLQKAPRDPEISQT